MRSLKFLAVSAAAAALFCVAPKSEAQATVAVQIGPAPTCPYGYYGYAPYHCAPRGYYGPEWFESGSFVGAGPWYHREHEFHGHVDERYDEHNGYRGPYPGREEHYRAYEQNEFHGNTWHDTNGKVWHEEHEEHEEHH